MNRLSEALGILLAAGHLASQGKRRGGKRSTKQPSCLHKLRLESLEERALLSVGGTAGTGASYLPAQHNLYELGGYLTGPSSGAPLDIAMAFLTSHADQLGVSAADILHSVVTDQYTSADTGMTHLYLRQELGGLQIINANINVNVTADGRVLSVGGGFVPGVSSSESASAAALSPIMTASQTLQQTARNLGLATDAIPVAENVAASSLMQSTTFTDSRLSLDPISAKLQYVATADGVQLTWEYVLRTPDGDHWYDVCTSSTTGKTLFANDWMDSASYTVYPLPAESPDDGSYTTVVDPASTTASPYGWHDTDGIVGAEYTDTRGNNVFAQDDWDADNTGGDRPDGGTSLTFDFPVDYGQDPHTYVSAAATNLFYWNNTLHDIHYAYGFTEAAGNFQQNNYGNGGTGGDAVQADCQDGSGANNANFATPPDGYAPRMQMYEFTRTTPHRDGDFDNLIVIHEYGHGVSNRLVGGPSNSNALSALQSGGMGEGWSDWWGLMLTQKATDTKLASYSFGAYAVGGSPTSGGLRRYPYSFDKTVNPLTYGAYNSSSEVHNSGEIWCSALWDMTWLLIDAHGYSSDISHGYSASDPQRSAGNNLALQLVMDSMSIMPANPSFLDGRNALLAADQALTGGANATAIWTAFARRGMGFSAHDGGSANAMTVGEAFDMPPADPLLTSHTPTGVTTSAITVFQFFFSEAMDTSSFVVGDDVASFTGPGGVDLRSQITGATWVNSKTLRVNVNAQSAVGAYTMVIGPQILAADNGNPMDQDRDGVVGEIPGDQYTATVTILESIFKQGLDANPGWTISGGEWAFGHPTGQGSISYGSPDPSNGYTGSNVYGVNLNGDYNTGLSGPFYLTSSVIDCSNYSNVTLDFERWLNTDSAGYVSATIDVWDGTTWHNVYTNPLGFPLTDSAWKHVLLPIGAYADGKSAVKIRWGYQVLQPMYVLSCSGWNIDDVSLLGIPVASDTTGPKVTNQTPVGIVGGNQTSVQFTFSEPMDTSSFNVTSDVVSFTGPSGNIKSQINGYSWINCQTLEVRFTSQTASGTYTMVIGPNITDDGPSFNQMNQDGDAVNGEASDDRYTASFQIPPPLYSANMDVNPGWTLDAGTAPYKWGYGKVSGSGGDPVAGHTGNAVMGYNLTGQYANSMTSTQYATTPAFSTIGYADVKLGFWRWLGVENGIYDHASIQVWDGSTWTTVWNHTSATFTETSWTYQEYVLPATCYDKAQVKIRWGMGTTDGSGTYCGWNIDDVVVTGTPAIDTTGPKVTAQTPMGIVVGGQASVQFTFSEPMDTSSFSVAADVVSFTGPDGVDLKSQITGFTWATNQTLNVKFNSQTAIGAYTMVIGPNINDDGPSFNAMNQDGDVLNGEVPADRYTASFTISLGVYSAGMSVDPGWTFDAGTAPYLWQYGTPTGNSGDPSSGRSGANVVGYNLNGSYADNMTTTQYATTPVFSTVGYTNVKLSFWRWLGIESAAYDHANIQVWDGSTWTTVWEHASGAVTDAGWLYQEIALPASTYGNAQVKIRWGMGGSDNAVNYCGWNIDDVLISGADNSDTAGPTVTAQTPLGDVAPGQTAMQFTFSEPMDTGSFTVAADVVSFTGPGGVDLKSQITGFSWTNDQTLKVQFSGQTAVGAYTMVIGPNITDNTPGANPMNQDGDAINGESPADCYSGSFTIVGSRIEGDEWNDLDGDGVRDSGEPILAGWTVYLDFDNDGRKDAGEPSQVTDASGHYVFDSLAPGTYSVREVFQTGWTQTCPIGSLHSLYAVDADLDELFLVDRGNGAATLVGSTASGPTSPGDLAWTGSAMYTIDLDGGELYSLNLTTGTPTLVGTTGLSGWQGLAADPTSGGQLYGIAGTSLYRISSGGVATLISNTVGNLITALAFDASGVLWGVDYFANAFGTINKTTGAFASVGTTIAGIQGMSFDESGQLYGLSTNDDSLYRINATTGVATLVGASGTQFVKGIGFDGWPGAGGNGARTVTLTLGQVATGLDFGNHREPSTRTWDGGGGSDHNWMTAANWSDDVAPAAGDRLVFAGVTQTSTYNNFDPGTVFGGIEFANGGFVLSGNSVTLTPAGGVAIRNAAGQNQIALPIGATSTGTTVVQAGTLQVGLGAQGRVLSGGVDMRGGSLVLDYSGGSSPAETVNTLMQASYHDGLWSNGPVTSSTLTAGLTLGWSDISSKITIRAVYPGDFNLDGTVDNSDLNVWKENIGSETAYWQQADATYDGCVDGLDLDMWKANSGKTLPSASGEVSSPASTKSLDPTKDPRKRLVLPTVETPVRPAVLPPVAYPSSVPALQTMQWPTPATTLTPIANVTPPPVKPLSSSSVPVAPLPPASALLETGKVDSVVKSLSSVSQSGAALQAAHDAVFNSLAAASLASPLSTNGQASRAK